MSSQVVSSAGARAFPNTRWPVVLAARRRESPESAAALETLCRAYWYPLYAFVRRSGQTPAEAQDLTQEFFCRLLEKHWLDAADRDKGRLRTFLVVALKKFLSNEWRRAVTALALIWCVQQAEPAASASSDTHGTWIATGDLLSRSYACVATLLPDGNVLLAGRAGSSDSTNSEVYEVASGKWTITSPLNERRGGHTLTLLPNGKVLAAGGYNNKDGLLSSAELFDPASRTWTKTGAMNSVHNKHTATWLPNGQVLVTGNNYPTNDSVTTELYDAATGKATRTTLVADPPPANGKGQIAGYSDRTNDFTSAELYDPATGNWKCTASLNRPRGRHTATLLTNGLVLVVGGHDKQGIALSSAELYDPTAGTWTEVNGLQLARGYHTATLLASGKVLVLGGQGSDGKPLSEAELFDPVTRQWAAAGAMMFARSYHTATLLKNGKVLVAGGSCFGGSLRFVEVYDPPTGAWTRARPMTTARNWHTATLLQDGRVLIAGGVGAGWNDPLSSAELFESLSRER